MSDLRVRMPEPDSHEPVGRDRFPSVIRVEAQYGDAPSEADADRFKARIAERDRRKRSGISTSFAFGGSPK